MSESRLQASINALNSAMPATAEQVKAMHEAGAFAEFFSVGSNEGQEITIEGDTVFLSPAGIDKEDFILDGIAIEFNGNHFMVNVKLASE